MSSYSGPTAAAISPPPPDNNENAGPLSPSAAELSPSQQNPNYDAFLQRIEQTLTHQDDAMSSFSGDGEYLDTTTAAQPNSQFLSQKQRHANKQTRNLHKKYENLKMEHNLKNDQFAKLQLKYHDAQDLTQNIKEKYDSLVEYLRENDEEFLPTQKREVFNQIKLAKAEYDHNVDLLMTMQNELGDLQASITNLHHDIQEMKTERKSLKIQEKRNHQQAANHAAHRTKQFERRSNKLQKSQQMKMDELESLQLQKEEQMQQVIENAKEQRLYASKRLAKTQKRVNAQKDKELQEANEKQQRKNRAFRSLHASTKRAMDKVKSANEKKAKSQKKQIEHEKNEMARIAAEGGNPYEVLRERKVRTQYNKNIRNMQRKMQKAQAAIEEKIKQEEQQFVKQNRETLKHEAAIDAWKDSISKRAQDEKVANYIASKTQNGADVIDPLGKQARIDPSKVIVTKDWSFGLGTTSVKNPHIMERMSKKYPKAGANATMIPKDESWAPGLSTGSGSTLGKLPKVKKEHKDEGEDSDEELAEPKFQGLWDQKQIISEDYVDENKLPVRQLTKLEKQYLEKKRKRNRANIVKKQVCWGKEFQGQAFVPEPKEIVFKDFELGKSYTKRIKLTNASLTFNYFKVLPLNDEIKNFFDIDYAPPGKMSAGTSSTITVTFRPRKLEDIDSVLPILAQTGKFTIPLRCLTKKVVVSVTSPQEQPDASKPQQRTLDFGSVMLAESTQVTVNIKNEGALDTALVLSGPAVMEHHLMHDEVNPKLPDRVLLFSSRQILIKKFSTTSFTIKFFPQKVQELESEVRLHFEDDYTEDFTFHLKGRGTDVSIYLERETMDFNFSYLNTLYRDSLVVCNRGKIAMKCEFPVPAPLRKHLEFVPNVAFVQPGDPFSIQVKFRPQEGILDDCAKYIRSAEDSQDAEGNSIRVPIKLSIPDQAMPVHTYLQTTITSSALEIQPSLIDFGFSSVDEAVSIPVSITNRSLLPQEFGFVKLPQEISIEPDHGFANILPGETLNYDVVFTPTAAIDYHMKCVLKTVRNQEFIIPCRAVGTQPPLKISKPLIISKSTAIGDFCSETIQLSNVSNKPQNFQFILSEEQRAAGVSILPTSGTIAPKKSSSMVVKYVPQPEFHYPQPEIPKESPPAEEAASGSKGKKGKPDKKKGGKSGKKGAPVEEESPQQEETPVEPPTPVDNYEHWDKSGDNEIWSRHKTWLLPCYIDGYTSGAITLGFQANVVKPHLTAETTAGDIVTSLDFQETPVQRPIRRSFFVCNNSNNRCELDFQPFEYAAFRIVKPPHPLGAGERCEVVVEFSPLEAIDYEHNLQLISPETNNLSVTLKGRGARPNLEIQPMDDVVEMGDALENDSDCEKQFSLTNNGTIPVPFEVQFPQSSVHPFNFDGSLPFSCNPSSGVVAPGETKNLTVSFLPDHACKYYRSEFWIVYGADEQTHKCLLTARAWKSGVFVVFDEKDMEKDTSDKAKEIASEAFEDPFADFGSVALDGTDATVKEHHLEQVFNNVAVGEKREFSFLIGNTKSAAKSKVDFNFEGVTAEDAKNGFSIEPQKGSVDAGQTKEITVRFSPSAAILDQMPVRGVDIWLELNCSTNLKNPASGEVEKFVFTFRGQVDSNKSEAASST